jgi:heme-degrading monooxygenase HmoA/predicted ester cyclase
LIAGGREYLTAEMRIKERVMYVRMNMMAGDPARLGDATSYIERSRADVEGHPGNRGVACLTRADLGICVVASYWDSEDAMTASEQAVQVLRKEMTEQIRGTVTVEHYEVPVFVRRRRPQAGAGVRITRLEVNPANLNAAIDEFRNSAVPQLMDMPGLCSAQLLADRTSGRCMVVGAWENMESLAASRSNVATLRADQAAISHLTIRSVEEYSLLFSSVREGDTRSLIEHDIQMWNAKDHDGWLAGADLQRLELRVPGGFERTGREGADEIWAMWHDAFPDNRLDIISIHGDDKGGVHEGRFHGTHTGTLRSPAGEIPATNRTVDAPFCTVYEFSDGKIISAHLYFDQAELLTQLGLDTGRPASGPA